MTNAVNNLRADIEELTALAGQLLPALADARTASDGAVQTAVAEAAAANERELNELDAQVQKLLGQFREALNGVIGQKVLGFPPAANDDPEISGAEQPKD